MKTLFLLLMSLPCLAFLAHADSPVIAPGAALEKLANDYSFTEGPASDAHGNILFTD
jgi:gluconolactonase